MIRILATLGFMLGPSTIFAGVAEAVNDEIVPGFQRFAESAADLDMAAQTACTGPGIEAAYNTAFDAWMGVSHSVFGPIEDLDLTLSFAFWPDPKNQTGKALGRLISAEDPVVNDRAGYSSVSVAAQGFFALERMLYDAPAEGAYSCELVKAIAANLSDNAAAVSSAWVDYADVVIRADNPRFQSKEEAQRAIYTSISTGLEFIIDQRLARPLGTFERPRPTRAEARRSGRSLRNVELGLNALQRLSDAFYDGETERLDAAYSTAYGRIAAIEEGDFSGVSNPGKRLRVEALQVDVREIQIETINEIGAALGLSAGFNALDGD